MAEAFQPPGPLGDEPTLLDERDVEVQQEGSASVPSSVTGNGTRWAKEMNAGLGSATILQG